MVPDVILARFLGLRVAAIAAITNMAAGISTENISPEHTKAMAPLGAAKLGRNLRRFLRHNPGRRTAAPRQGLTALPDRVHLNQRATTARPGRNMQLYLPIAEVSVSALLLLGLGGVVGLLSGLFGVGGGFLITPLLLFIGIPAPVAVATGANQVVASSVSGVLTHLRRKTVDLNMGTVLLAGGMVGSTAGIWVFNMVAAAGQIELFVQLCYVLFLGGIGGLMLLESLRALRRAKRNPTPVRRSHLLVHRLPLKVKFRVSGLYISIIPPIAVGLLVGFLAAIMGVGGGFIMVPAMIYVLGMPTKVVIGTSLFQILFVSAYTTLLHAVINNSVDILLAALLIVGGVIGAQLGTQLGARLKAEQLRILLALLVLTVCGKIALDLLLTPDDIYSLAGVRQ